MLRALSVFPAALAKDPQMKLEIDAYTDSAGDAGHNLKLSQLRAQAVPVGCAAFNPYNDIQRRMSL